MKKCPQCGNQFTLETDRCPRCDTQLPKKRNRFLRILSWTLMSLLGFSILLFIIVLIDPTPRGSKPAATDQARRTTTPAPQANVSLTPIKTTTVLSDIHIDFSWRTEGLGSIMTADFVIENRGPKTIKDLEITCDHIAESGTKIDSNTRTIYQVFPAGQKKQIKDFNMGIIHSQVKASKCRPTNLVVMK